MGKIGHSRPQGTNLRWLNIQNNIQKEKNEIDGNKRWTILKVKPKSLLKGKASPLNSSSWLPVKLIYEYLQEIMSSYLEVSLTKTVPITVPLEKGDTYSKRQNPLGEFSSDSDWADISMSAAGYKESPIELRLINGRRLHLLSYELNMQEFRNRHSHFSHWFSQYKVFRGRNHESRVLPLRVT